MKPFLARILTWWKSRTLGHRVILLFLGALIIGFSIYLDEGPKPWKEGIAPREAAGKSLKIAHYAVDGVFYGVIAALVIAALLVPFARFFGRPLGSDFRPDTVPRRRRLERWLLASVVIASALITANQARRRFDHSLWFDEEMSMRKAIVADHRRVGEDGRGDRFGDEVLRRPVTWDETLWFFETPNNHMLFSAFARLVHDAWPGPQTPDTPYFHAPALRLAALIPSVFSLAAIAVLLSVLGFRVAAFAAPPMLAIHPWFLRYASEARGYSLAIFLLILCILFFWKAAATGKWRWFALYGLCQFLLVYANLGSLWFLVVLNAAAALALCYRKDTSSQDRLVLLGRLLFANTMSAIVAIIMISPLLLQVEGRWINELVWPPDVLRDMAGSFFAGMRWDTWLSEYPNVVSIQDQLRENAPALIATAAWVVLLAVLGIITLAKRGGRHAFLIPVILLPFPFFLLVTYLLKGPLCFWYTVNLLPLLWIAVAIGLGALSKFAGSRFAPGFRGTATAACVLVPLTLAALWAVGSAQRKMQNDAPLELTLESVKATRNVLDPHAPGYDDVITVGIYHYTRAYDPGLYLVKNGNEMRRILAKADAEGKPLFANFAQPDFIRIHHPDVMQWIDDPDLFEEVKVFYAAEPSATRWVLRYKPGSLAAKFGG